MVYKKFIISDLEGIVFEKRILKSWIPEDVIIEPVEDFNEWLNEVDILPTEYNFFSTIRPTRICIHFFNDTAASMFKLKYGSDGIKEID